MISDMKNRLGWTAVMDERINPLKGHSLPVAHMMMQMLAWMWSAVFSISLGSYFAFGLTATIHSLVIAGIFVTLIVFRRADTNQ